MTTKLGERRETRESWNIALQAVPFTKEQAKAIGGPETVEARTLRRTQVAKVAMIQVVEERVHDRKATARKDAKERRKLAGDSTTS